MNKKLATFVILSSLFFGAIGTWIWQRFILPELNTIPFLVRYNLAPKAGPLVINNIQQVRVNEGSDTIAAVEAVQPWTVGVVANGQIIAGGLILTSDGLIATTGAVLNQPQLAVKLLDGTVLAGAQVKAQDPASNLVFLKVDGSKLSTANFADPKSLKLSQRVIVLSPSLGEFQSVDLVSYISSEVRNIGYSQIFSSEKISRTFGLSGLSNVMDGSVVLSADGNVEGIYSASGIIPADAVQSALNSYFGNNNKIVRNFAGLNYQYVPKFLASLAGQNEGVVLKANGSTPAVLPGSPAQKAGLQAGDFISSVDGTQINFDNSFEELLGRHKPGDRVQLAVTRGKSSLIIILELGSK